LREKLLEMSCNPPKPAVKAVETATKPAVESKILESKSAPSAPKPDASVSTDKTAAAKSDPAKADSKPAKADDKAAAAAKAASTDAAVPGTKPPVQFAERSERQASSRKPRMTSKNKTGGGLKLAKAKPQPDLNCPPPTHAGASEPVHPQAPAPQLTDAGNDGMFN